jgi:hypothetical protein
MANTYPRVLEFNGFSEHFLKNIEMAVLIIENFIIQCFTEYLAWI